MKRKGRLQKGMDADIIIFALNTNKDNAIFTEPVQSFEGMKFVVVNGTIIIHNGAPDIIARPGKAIRRQVTD